MMLFFEFVAVFPHEPGAKQAKHYNHYYSGCGAHFTPC